jgi:hypothetical protein
VSFVNQVLWALNAVSRTLWSKWQNHIRTSTRLALYHNSWRKGKFSWAYFFCFDRERLAYYIQFDKNVFVSHALRNSILPDNNAQSCPTRNTPQCLRDAVIMSIRPCPRSRDSSVDTATGYELDSRGSIPSSQRNFLYSTATGLALEPVQSPIQWVPQVLSLGVKRSGREAYHSLEVPRSRMVEL